MLCFKRIIFLFLINLLLFSFCSCKKIKNISFLGVSKVEVTCNLFTEVPHLEIYLFSTADYSELKMVKKGNITKISGYTKEILLLINDQKVPGYLHLFDVTFDNKEFVLQNISVLHKNQEIDVPIGMFQSVFLEPNTMEINSSIDIYTQDKLIGVMTCKNNLYTPIYYLEHKVVSIRKKQVISSNFLDRMVIYSDTFKSFNLFKVNIKEKYHQIGGIVQTKFRTSLDEYIIYTSYYYSALPSIKELSTVGIEVESLTEVLKS